MRRSVANPLRSTKLGIESLEERRCLAASVGWDGPGLGSASLTYYIGQAPAGLTQTQFESAIESALKVWSDVIHVTFTQTNQAGLANSLDFTSSSIDGAGGTLAQAYLPVGSSFSRLAGDVTFDSSEKWEVGNGLGAAAFDLLYVAVHEIGHALGLEHNAGSSVMAPSVSPTQSFTSLDPDDIDAALALYAPAGNSTEGAPSGDGGGSGLGNSATGTRGSGTDSGSSQTPRPGDRNTPSSQDRRDWNSNPFSYRWSPFVSSGSGSSTKTSASLFPTGAKNWFQSVQNRSAGLVSHWVSWTLTRSGRF